MSTTEELYINQLTTFFTKRETGFHPHGIRDPEVSFDRVIEPKGFFNRSPTLVYKLKSTQWHTKTGTMAIGEIQTIGELQVRETKKGLEVGLYSLWKTHGTSDERTLEQTYYIAKEELFSK